MISEDQKLYGCSDIVFPDVSHIDCCHTYKTPKQSMNISLKQGITLMTKGKVLIQRNHEKIWVIATPLQQKEIQNILNKCGN